MELLSVTIIFACMLNSVQCSSNRTFPNEFIFGSGFSAYQAEGASYEYGKGENFFEYSLRKGDIFKTPDGSNADVASDVYHHYKEDGPMWANMGMQMIRWSVSWARVLPEGTIDHINQEGIEYYKNFLQTMLDNGMESMVTLYHWDHPQALESNGGWLNATIIDIFVDYARLMFEILGPKVKYFLTMNQPGFFCEIAYGSGIFPPGKKLGFAATQLCTYNMLMAHAKVYHMYNDEFRALQGGYLGLSVPVLEIVPKNPYNPIDRYASEYGFQMTTGMIMNPLVHGDFPLEAKVLAYMSGKIEAIPDIELRQLSTEEIGYMKGTLDYVGINYYYHLIIHVEYTFEKGLQISLVQSEDEFTAVDNIRDMLREIKIHYNNPTVIITENGLPDDGQIQDYRRVEYFANVLDELLLAIREDECNVIGYLSWAIIDNFEFTFGYTRHYGLIGVNFTDPNRNRTMKHSGMWWTDFLKTRDLDDPNLLDYY